MINVSYLVVLMKEAKLSPEELGGRLGISGMTIRRWRDQRKDRALSAPVERSIIDVIYQLAAEGRLSADSASVATVIREQRYIPFVMAMKHLGCSMEKLRDEGDEPQQLLECLSEIGADHLRQAQVERSANRLAGFARMGAEWKTRISTLLDVIHSKRLLSFQKMVAYGALFYLLTPFDMIPDQIPVFGLLDDFAILGIAATQYQLFLQRPKK